VVDLIHFASMIHLAFKLALFLLSLVFTRCMWFDVIKSKRALEATDRVVDDIFIHCLITIYSFIRSDND
jgi:hypothetical protein